MILGKNIETGENVHLDLKKLIKTRLLIQANSGGGKSWCARRIMEQTHKEVQQIIIDTEGEFPTLREKYDYLLVGSDGEIPTTIKTANLLPKKIMQLKVSVIIDLSEMSKSEKCTYIKEFLTALLRLPREFWTPLLVFIDEAHDFAPEGQKGKAESKPSVINLCSKGRKRRYCAVLMTQRGAKLDKDASAECNNKLTGLANIDVDRKRAGEDLGFTSKEEERKLRTLEAGEMYCYGSAISRDVLKIKIGPVNTTHEEEDEKIPKPAKTPDNIKKVLKNFIDLPKEAEKDLHDKQELEKRIVELKKDINVLKRQKPIVKKEVDTNQIKIMERQYQKSFKEAEINFKKSFSSLEMQYKKQLIDKDAFYKKGVKILENEIYKLRQFIIKINQMSKPFIENIPLNPFAEMHVNDDFPKIKFPEIPRLQPIQSQVPANLNSEQIKEVGSLPDAPIYVDEEFKLPPAYARLLKACAMFYPNPITKTKLSLLADVPKKASTFRNGLSKLKTSGLISVGGADVVCTEKGLEIAGDDVEELPTETDELVNMWCNKLPPAYERMFRVIVEFYPNGTSKEDLSIKSDVPMEASTFRNGLSRLKTLELIKVEDGMIVANTELFE